MSIIFSWDRIRFLKIIQSELALHPKTDYSILISNKDRGLLHETIIHRLEGSRSRPDISILMESNYHMDKVEVVVNVWPPEQ